MVDIIHITRKGFHDTLIKAKEVVDKEGVLIYPTDTLYGIGGDAHSMEVVERINKIKAVTEFKPMSVIFSDIPMIKEYCEVSHWQEEFLNRYLPGPFTFLLKLHRPLPVTNNIKLGVRIPETTFCHELAEICRKPIVTTSANVTGKPPPFNFKDVDPEIVDKADLAIDEGITRYKYHSEVVDLVEKRILRRGGKDVDLALFPKD